jgi:hypothetical protein
MRGSQVILTLAALLVAGEVSAADDESWPRRFEQDGNQLLASQPQLDGWTDRVTFAGRVAVIVTPKNGSSTRGVLRITAQTDADFQKRAVVLTNIQVTDARFSAAPAPDAARAAALAKALFPKDGLSLSLDYLLAALVQSGQRAVSVQLDTTPPKIFLAEQPTRLVLFEGAPAFAPVQGTNVEHAINTNWPLLRITDAPGYYLLDSTGWLTTEALESGLWQYTSQLPDGFSKLPSTTGWQDVTQAVPAPPTEGQPPLQVYVSTTPAELIVMVGEPQYTPIPGTGLFYIENTDSLVFWDGYAKAFYYLVAGRWFRASALAGPWVHATRDLPPDFARIPPDGPLAAVLASVPNTTEAREAALQAQIPRLAVASRKDTTAKVAYDGAPQFAPIEGTALSYAVNTRNDVIRVGDGYYLCEKGVWFTSNSPNGPWVVATAVPDQIYAIPPSSPVYNVTYVKVYQVAAADVVDGYTDGYLGGYVADGVVTWGTGYYYPPYIAVGAVPYYYPRPYTYGCDAFYNPLTGSFHRAGYGYGPYGGIGAGAVYDPDTGTSVRGVAVYGPYEAGRAVQAYNPRTGTYAAGRGRSNPYASWEQGVVYGPARSARGGTYSDDRGTVARVQTSGGAEAVAATDGDRSAAVVRTSDGDWYAGGDDNLYRRGGDGWQRYDTGREAAPAEGERVAEADARSEAPRGPEVVYGAPAGADAGVSSGLGRPVGAAGFLPASGLNPELVSGLEREYAARQRMVQMDRRYANWDNRRFGGLGGGRYTGLSRGGFGRR